MHISCLLYNHFILKLHGAPPPNLQKTPTPTPSFLIRAPRTAGSESIKGCGLSGGSVGSSPCDGSHGISSTIAYLVGGFNPLVKLGIFAR